jgi:hypothetical protein
MGAREERKSVCANPASPEGSGLEPRDHEHGDGPILGTGPSLGPAGIPLNSRKKSDEKKTNLSARINLWPRAFVLLIFIASIMHGLTRNRCRIKL